MELSPQNLSVLFEGYEMIFNRGFEGAPSYWQMIATEVPSGTKETLYPFLKRTLQLREFTGARVLQNLEAVSYLIVNRHFEGTIGINLDDLKDDQYGVYNDMIASLGEAVKVWPDQLIFSMMKAAVTGASVDIGMDFVVPPPIGYDGVPFFSANHPTGPVGRGGGVQSNINSSGTGSYWFLINGARAVRPFLWQTREPFKFVRMNAVTDEKVFTENIMRVGVDGRANAGVSLWQLAYASNTDLSNPANYGAAIAAMREIKDDAGRPFGSWTGDPAKKFLVVPPSLEETARQLLHSEFGAIAGTGGAVAGVPGTNIWRNSATLIVSDYLS